MGLGMRVGALLLAVGLAGAEEGADPPPASPTGVVSVHDAAPRNRLAAEASPYLQLHAANPVDWYPWGPEAFARARQESKPIFLSVGYSSCYWCHVMERLVFSNTEIAALMNRDFVNVKVDREERPDVDEIYMTATRILTRSGGWPNSVFLTPEGDPFYAGTYFPPEGRHGRPGFPRVLRQAAEAWQEDRAGVEQRAREVASAIAQSSQLPPISAELPTVTTLLSRSTGELARSFDAMHGGFYGRTKFPRPSYLELLLASHAEDPDPQTLAMVTETLDQMALGGIYDHLAGGFHRYTVESTWSIPHFEKMLYDNAQLVALYARAYRVTGRERYREVVADVIRYLEREMTHPEGGFYSAQDAEVDGEEGASYVWTREEVAEVLGEEETREFLSVYELRPMHGGKGVLRVRLPVEASVERLGVKNVSELLVRFAPARAKLLAARNRRPQPLRDDKVLAAWNGLAIRGLVEAGLTLQRADYLRSAERSAHFVLDRLGTGDGGLRRSYIAGQAREEAVLDDYAYLAHGLLALHAATGNEAWLAQSRVLVDTMLERFEDPDSGGFFLTAFGTDPKPLDDGALPSGNGIALAVLRELAARTSEDRYGEAVQRTTAALAHLLQQNPAALGTVVVALAENPTAAPHQEVRALAAKPRGSLPRSEDHVSVQMKQVTTDPPVWAARLEIDEGWHVNANPASLPFLIPTSVEFEGSDVEEITYPQGKRFHPDFAPSALLVYEGTVEIPATLATSNARSVKVAVRFQACDALRCLPPGLSRIQLAPPGAAARVPTTESTE
jgi:uncharacterized protein YyaL (SSP411 family)